MYSWSFILSTKYAGCDDFHLSFAPRSAPGTTASSKRVERDVWTGFEQIVHLALGKRLSKVWLYGAVSVEREEFGYSVKIVPKLGIIEMVGAKVEGVLTWAFVVVPGLPELQSE